MTTTKNQANKELLQEIVNKLCEMGITQCVGTHWRDQSGETIWISNVEEEDIAVAAVCMGGAVSFARFRKWISEEQKIRLFETLLRHSPDHNITYANDILRWTFKDFVAAVKD